MIADEIKKKLVVLYVKLDETKDEEKQEHLLNKAATEIFNLVNCREEEFYKKMNEEK